MARLFPSSRTPLMILAATGLAITAASSAGASGFSFGTGLPHFMFSDEAAAPKTVSDCAEKPCKNTTQQSHG